MAGTGKSEKSPGFFPDFGLLGYFAWNFWTSKFEYRDSKIDFVNTNSNIEIWPSNFDWHNSNVKIRMSKFGSWNSNIKILMTKNRMSEIRMSKLECLNLNVQMSKIGCQNSNTVHDLKLSHILSFLFYYSPKIVSFGLMFPNCHIFCCLF